MPKMPVRQPGSGRGPPVQIQQRRRGHASAQVPYIHGGPLGLSPLMGSSYLDTDSNHLADDLSRNCAFSFLSKVPSADPHPTPTSTCLLELLLNAQANWVSQQWRRQFGNIFRRD